jgi:hypothetical protein
MIESPSPAPTQEREKRMRRKRFQRGSLKAHKRRGKVRWYAQWREEGIPRSKELGLCSEVSRISAEAMLQDILKPINEGTERREKADHTFEAFIELVYLPVFEQKWKDSTKDTEATGYGVIWFGNSEIGLYENCSGGDAAALKWHR